MIERGETEVTNAEMYDIEVFQLSSFARHCFLKKTTPPGSSELQVKS